MTETPPTTPAPVFCANHPNRETLLRCNICGKPICTECAQRRPTGYSCKDCMRGQQKRFENAKSLDYVLAAVITAALAFIGSFIADILSFFIIFVAPIIGIIIVSAVQRVLKHRRSRTLFLVTAGAALLGSLPLLVIKLISFFGLAVSGGLVYSILDLVWQGVYAFLITTTIYYRISGIQL